MEKGIDVGHWNTNVDFNSVKNEGLNFCIVRITERDKDTHQMVLDPLFINNINNAIAAGLKIGLYCVSRANNVDEALEEAKFTDSMIKQYCSDTKIEMGIWYDVEDQDTTGSNDNETITAIISKYICSMNEFGYTNVGVYANKNWLVNKINVLELANYIQYWVAFYSDKNDIKDIYPNMKVAMWQYTDHYSDDLPYDSSISYL